LHHETGPRRYVPYSIWKAIGFLVSWTPILRWLVGILYANGCPHCTVLNATAQHRIPKVSCNWRIWCQRNPVSELCYINLLNASLMLKMTKISTKNQFDPVTNSIIQQYNSSHDFLCHSPYKDQHFFHNEDSNDTST
jgi:hypothetical protein